MRYSTKYQKYLYTCTQISCPQETNSINEIMRLITVYQCEKFKERIMY